MSSRGTDFDFKPGSRDSLRVHGTIRSGHNYLGHASAHKACVSKIQTHVDCCNDGQWPRHGSVGCVGHQNSCKTTCQNPKLFNLTTDGLAFDVQYSLNKNRRWVKFSSPEQLIATVTTDRCDDRIEFHVDAIELWDDAGGSSAKQYAATTSNDFCNILSHRVASTGSNSGPSLIETIRNMNGLETRISTGCRNTEQNRENPAPVIRFTVQKMNPDLKRFCHRFTNNNAINLPRRQIRKKAQGKGAKIFYDKNFDYDAQEKDTIDKTSDSEFELGNNDETVKRRGFCFGDFIIF